ncbi:DUF397 domain-containing protein [Saccharopolyspora gregorii]|uniref:DUF397 domain-containing protein n=1 Tax=Saccharopolyspora gregorii TaxID=33914 RepID=A0ABP6RHF7_9PSEU
MTEPTWRKSSRSNAFDNCVEVALSQDAAAVRDSKDRTAGFLLFSRRDWRRFLSGVGEGHYDR